MPPNQVENVPVQNGVGNLFKGVNAKMPGRGRKRNRESEDSTPVTAKRQKGTKEDSAQATGKRQKVHHPSHRSTPGTVLTCGEGDVGQLGLGEDVIEKARPAVVDIPDPVVQVYGGGMHTVCLTEKGEVYTFGCNDEGTLGRDTSDEGTETVPGKVDGLPRIVQVCAGDSHTAALSDDGRVYAWGNFRDANGSMGFTKDGSFLTTPVPVLTDQVIVKIESGNDHLVCLSNKGEIWTLGCAEQGQLGRVAECFAHRGGRKGLDYILSPEVVHFRKRKLVFSDIWTGCFVTFAKEKNTGDVYSWGLSNYYQLGFPDMLNRFVPEKVKTFDKKNFISIAGGQHHTVALDADGNVYTFGRAEYGRLGLGENCGERKEPSLVKLENKCTDISAGSSVSFALTEDGTVSCWGMGTSNQLATGDDEDAWVPVKMGGKQIQDKQILQVSAGGQHTVLLVKDK